MANVKVVYLIREVGERTIWTRQGAAFENRDGSLNLKLDLFPSLTFNIRDPKKDQDEEGEDTED